MFGGTVRRWVVVLLEIIWVLLETETNQCRIAQKPLLSRSQPLLPLPKHLAPLSFSVVLSRSMRLIHFQRLALSASRVSSIVQIPTETNEIHLVRGFESHIAKRCLLHPSQLRSWVTVCEHQLCYLCLTPAATLSSKVTIKLSSLSL